MAALHAPVAMVTGAARVQSPVASNPALDALVAQHIKVVQRVRRYLAIVYPSAHFANDTTSMVPNVELVHFFRSLATLYQGAAGADVPLDALEPRAFGVGSEASRSMRCASTGGGRFGAAAARALLGRTPQQLYHGLVPCELGAGCVRALSRFAPAWLHGVEERVGAGAFFEVRRFAHETWWYGSGSPPDGHLRQPTTWGDFEDLAGPRGEGSGWWYQHAPGSGIFYTAGRTLVAATKVAMLVRLLEQWQEATVRSLRLEREVQRVAGANVSSFLHRLRSVRDGAASCREAGVPHCYDELRGGALYRESWTLYDEPYDELTLQLGRSLGYDTLFYSASFLRPDILRAESATQTARFAGAEIVDLRRPAWASRTSGAQDASDTSDAWIVASPQSRANAWAEDVRARGTLSLRDPLDPGRAATTRPCDFAIHHQLACRGHVSWEFRGTHPGLLQCSVPQYEETECAEWCWTHQAEWHAKCQWVRCRGCLEACATPRAGEA